MLNSEVYRRNTLHKGGIQFSKITETCNKSGRLMESYRNEQFVDGFKISTLGRNYGAEFQILGIYFDLILVKKKQLTMVFTVEFYITMSYSIFSCIVYILVSYLIIKNKHIFFGSYYKIILVDSAVNVSVFLTSIISFRLPRATNKDSLFADVLPQLPFLNFFGCMMCHLPYVQYLMVLTLIFNRFTAVVFHLKYKKVYRIPLHLRNDQIWEYLFIPLMLFNIFFPFIFTWHWFTADVYFAYNEPRDAYMLKSNPDQYKTLNGYLSITRIVATILGAILMVATIFFYKYKAKVREQQVEVGLLIFSVISFLVQFLGTFAIFTQYLKTTWEIHGLSMIGQYGILYTKDCATFGSPYILLLCCRRLRRLLKEMFLGTRSKSSTVAPMYRRPTV